jgi:hypothetical protein
MKDYQSNALPQLLKQLIQKVKEHPITEVSLFFFLLFESYH